MIALISNIRAKRALKHEVFVRTNKCIEIIGHWVASEQPTASDMYSAFAQLEHLLAQNHQPKAASRVRVTYLTVLRGIICCDCRVSTTGDIVWAQTGRVFVTREQRGQ